MIRKRNQVNALSNIEWFQQLLIDAIDIISQERICNKDLFTEYSSANRTDGIQHPFVNSLLCSQINVPVYVIATIRDVPVDPLFPIFFQILPDNWVQELLDHVRKLKKDTDNDHLAFYGNDIVCNSSILFTNDQDNYLLGKLWKESDVSLMHDNGEYHLDDDGEPVVTIESSSNGDLNFLANHVFTLQSAVQDEVNNGDNIIIDNTNNGIAGSMYAAKNKQPKVQNDKVEKTISSKETGTNNTDDRVTVIAAITKYIKLQNDKEEETVYRVTDSYDFHNITNYLQWIFYNNDNHQFDLTFINSKSSTIIPVSSLNSGIEHIYSTSCGPSNIQVLAPSSSFVPNSIVVPSFALIHVSNDYISGQCSCVVNPSLVSNSVLSNIDCAHSIFTSIYHQLTTDNSPMIVHHSGPEICLHCNVLTL